MAVKKTVKDFKREIVELRAQLAHAYHFASIGIDKAGTRNMMASGVLVHLTALGGREIIDPVVIKDGLSDDTIKAIKADMVRSYEIAVAFKPKVTAGVK